MASSHLKRIVAPKTWPIVRKTTKFISRPKPSGTKIGLSLPIVVIMRDVLGLVENAAQTRRILRTEPVTVNGRRIHDTDSAVCFMDLFAVGGKTYRLLINTNNKLVVVPVTADEHVTIQKIAGKTSVGRGRAQINCVSGYNIIVDKDSYKVGDSVAITLASEKEKHNVSAHYPLAAGACVLLTGGSHIGKIGIVESIAGQTITVTVDGQKLETAKAHAYVVGKDKPAVKLA